MKSFKRFLAENEHIKYYTTVGKGYELNKKLIDRFQLSKEESATTIIGLRRFIRENRIRSHIINLPPVRLQVPSI